MTARFASQIFGWRTARNKRVVPNVADSNSDASVAIAAEINGLLGIKPPTPAAIAVTGASFEALVRDELAEDLEKARPGVFSVDLGRRISAFNQYRHLEALDALVRGDRTGTLSAEIGRDYQIAPDVVVSVGTGAQRPMLHGFVSCKLTIRSDRVQNVRHEGIILTRHRRGRQPHVVAVTGEPFPSRLASIARGTGELDAVYHVALEELVTATEMAGSSEQRHVLEELTSQERLLDFSQLPQILAV